MTETILIADDDPVQLKMLDLLLTKKLGYNTITASNGQEAVDIIRKSNYGDVDLAILDVSMPVMDGIEALLRIRKIQPDLPTLILTATANTNVVVQAMKSGANDFIMKPINPNSLDLTLKNTIRISNLSKEVKKLRREKEGALAFEDLIGYNNGLSDAVSLGRKASCSDVTVLITGETGVGKELFARAIHGESKRMGSPFIAINCGAIPENLVESTLFGHEKGSFTGAIQKSIGKFREAEGGTIFLDEVGELPLEAQVKLLRVVQQKEIEPVGAGKTIRTDVRLIFATNRDLLEEVKQGRFREDLYFRINVLEISVPPLRKRKEDIISLAEYFIRKFSHTESLPEKKLSEDAKKYLTNSNWSGNVRELENLLHRALVVCEGSNIDAALLTKLHKPAIIENNTAENIINGIAIGLQNADNSFKSMEQLEQEAMQAALQYYDNNITKAAEALKIAKSTFYRKIKDV